MLSHLPTPFNDEPNIYHNTVLVLEEQHCHRLGIFGFGSKDIIQKIGIIRVNRLMTKACSLFQSYRKRNKELIKINY